MKKISVVVLLVLLAGCLGPTPSRREGFSCFDRAHELTEGDPGTDGFTERLAVDQFRIQIMDQPQIPYYDRSTAEYQHGVVGSARPSQGLIRILGKKVNGKIVVNQAVLGHELLHLLHFKHPALFHDPDLLDKEGL